METKIGIDLGTSTCEISYLENGEAKVIKNLQEGESTIIPSAILFCEKNDFKVGNVAKKKSILNPELVVENIKGIMGSKKSVTLGNEIYTAEYISAILAKRLKEIAEFNMNQNVNEVVVTVPAKFDSLQRKATRDALIIAGFKDVEIINEPTAAAIAYGLTNIDKVEKVLVYDLGGGTFDVSILEIENNNYNVLASEGDLTLGGNAINKILFDTIVNLFETSVGTKLDSSNKRLITELNKEIEEAKKTLSFENVASIVVPNIALDNEGNSMDLNLDLSREDFEYLIDNFLDDTLQIVENTLRSINIEKDRIDKVLLVGGSTRIPLVKERVNNLFKGKILNGVNPEEIVAKGAILSTLNKDKARFLVNEIINNDIGIEVLGKKFDKIIEKGAKLPITVKKSYRTVEDSQEIAEIKIYEGQAEKVDENKFISSFDVDNIPKDEKGIQLIELIFTCNTDGVLVANSRVLSNMSEIKKDISLKGLNDKDIEILKEKVKMVKVFDNISSQEIDNREKINEEEMRKKKAKEDELRNEIEIKRLEAIKRQEEEKIRREAEIKRLEELEKQKEIEKQRELEKQRLEQIERERTEALERQKQEEERLEKERIMIEQKKNEEEAKEKAKVPSLKLNLSSNQVRNVVEKTEISNQVGTTIEVTGEEAVQKQAMESFDTSDLIEEYDPSRDGEIYNDIATLMEYYKRISPELSTEEKEKAQELIGDLTNFVKQDMFREAREKENEIIQLIYRG